MPHTPPWLHPDTTDNAALPQQYAVAYAKLGWPVLPLHTMKGEHCSCGTLDCRTPGKHPITAHGLHDATTDEEQVRRWWQQHPGANIGIAMGQIAAVDVDPRNGGDITNLPHELPATLHAITGGGGAHYLYQFPHPVAKAKLAQGIDLIGQGGYIVVEPSLHAQGAQYHWQDWDPETGQTPTIADAPDWLLEQTEQSAPGATTQKDNPEQWNETLPEAKVSEIREALKWIDANDRDIWVQVGQALHSTRTTNARQLWDQWSEHSPKFDLKDQNRVWRSFTSTHGITLSTLFGLAKLQGVNVGKLQPVLPTPAPKLVWYADITPAPNKDALVDKTLLPHQLSVCYGVSNIGKSFFALDLSLHVAAGNPWHGRNTQQGGVIYIATEGAYGSRNRVCAWRNHYGVDDPLPFALMASSIDLLRDNDPPMLIDLIHQAAEHVAQPIELVVVDTLSRALAGGNENSSEDMGRLVINADLIRSQTNAHLMFVHHSGKDQARGARGHSLLRAATDTEIELVCQDGITSVTASKQRDIEGGHVMDFQLDQVGVTDSVTSCVIVPRAYAQFAQGAPAPKRATQGQQQVFDQIAQLIATGRQRLTDSGQNPDNASTTFPALADRCWEAGLLGNIVTSRYKNLRRKLDALVELGLIEHNDKTGHIVTKRNTLDGRERAGTGTDGQNQRAQTGDDGQEG